MACVAERGQRRWGLEPRKHVCSLLQPEGTAKSERPKTDLHVASKKKKKTNRAPLMQRGVLPLVRRDGGLIPYYAFRIRNLNFKSVY